MQENEYQLQPAHVGFVPQVLPEVEAIHVLVDETERVCLGRVNPDERYYVHISAVKEAACANLVEKPL